MLTNFLEKSKPINFIVYIGLFFCFFFFALFSNFISTQFTLNLLLESSLFVISFLVIFFFYNFIVSKNKLTFDHSYAFFFFTITFTPFINSVLEREILLIFIVYLLFLRKIYSLRSSNKVIQKTFDSGFWLAILFIIEPSSILFLVLLYAAILLQQKANIHTLISPIIGFLTPLFIYFSYLFWKDATESFTKLFEFNISNNYINFSDSPLNYFLTAITLLSLFSFFIKSPKALSVNNSFKKSWILLIINLLIAIILVIINPKENGIEYCFLFVPASIIMANGFEVIQNKIIKNIIIGIIFLSVLFTFFSTTT